MTQPGFVGETDPKRPAPPESMTQLHWTNPIVKGKLIEGFFFFPFFFFFFFTNIVTEYAVHGKCIQLAPNSEGDTLDPM